MQACVGYWMLFDTSGCDLFTCRCSVVTIAARSCVGYWMLFDTSSVTLSQMFSGY